MSVARRWKEVIWLLLKIWFVFAEVFQELLYRNLPEALTSSGRAPIEAPKMEGWWEDNKYTSTFERIQSIMPFINPSLPEESRENKSGNTGCRKKMISTEETKWIRNSVKGYRRWNQQDGLKLASGKPWGRHSVLGNCLPSALSIPGLLSWDIICVC